ncbi:unnamed protein product [Owenia fusiformis]|uniref:Peptidase S1 domain-containing protein n=1 Tax=Owenia fusiformis TaxID=6347 RepID=A0A8S4NY24_OWEFU|nr:unnamed protein product [Owenia fusiformis]
MLLGTYVILVAISIVKCAPSSQIISGVEAIKGEFPSMLSLQRFNSATGWSHVCGATLINFEHSITAATCFLQSSNATEYRVVAGLHELVNTPEQQFLTVSTIDINPSFANDPANGYPNNIAVLRHQAATRTAYVNVIALPTTATYYDQFCNITGWGRYEGGEPAPVLRRAMDRVINDLDCNAAYPTININYNYHICFGDGQISACGVDHGGPIICPEPQGSPAIAGVNSFNDISCQNGPSVYTRVSTYLTWICSITQSC